MSNEPIDYELAASGYGHYQTSWGLPARFLTTAKNGARWWLVVDCGNSEKALCIDDNDIIPVPKVRRVWVERRSEFSLCAYTYERPDCDEYILAEHAELYLAQKRGES